VKNVKEYREMLKSAGLCTRCKGPSRQARRECEKCSRLRSESDRKRVR
jgi:hypothetical protein